MAERRRSIHDRLETLEDQLVALVVMNGADHLLRGGGAVAHLLDEQQRHVTGVPTVDGGVSTGLPADRELVLDVDRVDRLPSDDDHLVTDDATLDVFGARPARAGAATGARSAECDVGREVGGQLHRARFAAVGPFVALMEELVVDGLGAEGPSVRSRAHLRVGPPLLEDVPADAPAAVAEITHRDGRRGRIVVRASTQRVDSLLPRRVVDVHTDWRGRLGCRRRGGRRRRAGNG